MPILLVLAVLVFPGCQPSAKPAAPPKTAKTTISNTKPIRNVPESGASLKKPVGVIPQFRMIGKESGLAFERNDDIRGQHRITESNGGGVALLDFDCDGWLDVFFTNGCRLPLSLNDQSTPSELFRNRGEFRFDRTTTAAQVAQFGYAQGCAIGDYDNDGFDDLYVTALGPDSLWHNNGDGTFSDMSQSAGITAPQWGSSAAFADLNNDGNLDLYVVNYLEESDEKPKVCPNPKAPDGFEQCPPAMFAGADDVVYFSDAAGGFQDVSAKTGVAGLRGKGLGVVVSDFNRDFIPEIYVANDGEANFLLTSKSSLDRVGGAAGHASPSDVIKYVDVGQTSGCALSEAGFAQASMGVAAGDYDNNGTLDLFLTHFYNDTNTLYANRGGLAFEDVTRTNILGASSRNRLGFGTAFLDADNDGWLDVIVANGHIDDKSWLAHGEPYRMRPQFYRNERAGAFVEVSEWSGDYFHKDWLGRGVAVGDLDRDGRWDAVISHQRAPSVALRNETTTDFQSISLHFAGTHSNRSGIGAQVEILSSEVTLVRELVGGASFQSASALEIHIGVQETRKIDIQVTWPSGRNDRHLGLRPGRWLLKEATAVDVSLP